MKLFTHNRRVPWRSENQIGLARFDAKVGDKICVLYGGSVLYVIRENKTKPGDTFIGQRHVDSVMAGEAAALLRDGRTQDEVFVLGVKRLLFTVPAFLMLMEILRA